MAFMMRALRSLGLTIILSVGALAPASAAPQERWITAFGRTLQWPVGGTKTDFSGRTLRYVATLAADGKKIRVRISNELPELNDAWLGIGNATIAILGDEKSTVKYLTWGGEKVGHAPPGAPLISDPIAFNAKPLQKVVISLYFPGAFQPLASDRALSVDGPWQMGAQRTNAAYTEKGDFVDQFDAALTPLAAQPLITGVEVVPASAGWRSVLVLGTTRAASLDAWPAKLIKRASTQKIAIASISQSAGGMYRAPVGQNDLARFDRDVLARPNVNAVVLQTGGDDVIWAGLAMLNDQNGGKYTPEPVADLALLTSGYRQLAGRAHDHGIKVIATTLHPWKGAPYDINPLRLTRRAEINAWMSKSSVFDGVIDGVTPLADPADPTKLAAKYDSGDHMNVTADGNQAFADSIDLSLFRK